MYWCHSFCELGATGGVELLEEVRDFMATHPYEVVLMSIEDDVSPGDTETIFKESGLLEYLYQGPLTPLPTLRELIDGGERLIVMGEEHTGRVPWFHQQFEFVQETPYEFKTVADLERPDSCDPNRGGPDNPLLLLNHWVETTPAPRVTNAARKFHGRAAGARGAASECAGAWRTCWRWTSTARATSCPWPPRSTLIPRRRRRSLRDPPSGPCARR